MIEWLMNNKHEKWECDRMQSGPSLAYFHSVRSGVVRRLRNTL